jgi:hypothetical protein
MWIGDVLGTEVVYDRPWTWPGRLTSSCGGLGPEAVIVWTAPWSGSFVFDTWGSTYDTVLSLRSGGCNGVELACNDDYMDLTSRVEVSLRGGQEVYVIVDSYSDATGWFALNIMDASSGAFACDAILDLGGMTGSPVASGTLPSGASGLSNSCGGVGAAAVFRWTPPSPGEYRISTTGSNFDTVLDARYACEGPPFACDDDGDGLQSVLHLWGEAGVPLYFVLQQYGGMVGTGPGLMYQLNITLRSLR